jgi:hypothetical protein
VKRRPAESEKEDEMRPEYDLSKLTLIGRGVYAERYRAGTKFVLLEADQSVEETADEEDDLNEPGNISDTG